MIRESADEGAASANACKHIDGLVVLQWRPYHGMYMRDPEEERFYPKRGGQTIQLSRIGKTITMKIAHPGEPLQLVGSYETETLGGDVLAGLYICAHDSNVLASAKVWNVRIDKPSLYLCTRLECARQREGMERPDRQTGPSSLELQSACCLATRPGHAGQPARDHRPGR
jgi:hypothetical protein